MVVYSKLIIFYNQLDRIYFVILIGFRCLLLEINVFYEFKVFACGCFLFDIENICINKAFIFFGWRLGVVKISGSGKIRPICPVWHA